MASNKIILILAIIASSDIFSVTVSGAALVNNTESYQGTVKEKLLALYRKDAVFKMEMQQVWTELDNIYKDYETWNRDYFVQGCVRILKEQTDYFWIELFIDYFKLLTVADLKNKFYIRFLKEINKQKAFAGYGKNRVDEIIYRLEQMDPNKTKKPSWLSVMIRMKSGNDVIAISLGDILKVTVVNGSAAQLDYSARNQRNMTEKLIKLRRDSQLFKKDVEKLLLLLGLT